MISKVNVNANVVDTRQVEITVRHKGTGEIIKKQILYDGESYVLNVFDDFEIIISEIDK